MLCKHPSGGLSCTTFFYGKPIFLLFLFSVCVLFTIFVQNIISPSERSIADIPRKHKASLTSTRSLKRKNFGIAVITCGRKKFQEVAQTAGIVEKNCLFLCKRSVYGYKNT